MKYRSDEGVAEWMRQYWRDKGEEIDWPRPYICFGVESDEGLGLGVIYERILNCDVNMHIVCSQRKLMTRRVIRAAFTFPFVNLGRQRVTGLVPAINMLSRELCEKLGFELEGRRKRVFVDDDEMIYGMTKEQCRWLK